MSSELSGRSDHDDEDDHPTPPPTTADERIRNEWLAPKHPRVDEPAQPAEQPRTNTPAERSLRGPSPTDRHHIDEDDADDGYDPFAHAVRLHDAPEDETTANSTGTPRVDEDSANDEPATADGEPSHETDPADHSRVEARVSDTDRKGPATRDPLPDASTSEGPAHDIPEIRATARANGAARADETTQPEGTTQPEETALPDDAEESSSESEHDPEIRQTLAEDSEPPRQESEQDNHEPVLHLDPSDDPDSSDDQAADHPQTTVDSSAKGDGSTCAFRDPAPLDRAASGTETDGVEPHAEDQAGDNGDASPVNTDDEPGTASTDDGPAAPDKPTYSLDTKLDADTTARDVLTRYDPTVAGLEPMTLDEAVEYIATHKDARPWLQPAADCEPIVQRVYATLDTGIGHAHQRHDGMGDSETYERRVTYLEDPAQLDPVKLAKSQDAFKPEMHYCGGTATRIPSPEAFSTAIARALEDPRVQASLGDPWRPERPAFVRIPIADLLGPHGHQQCEGHQLDGWPLSKLERKWWAKGRANGESLSALTAPTCRPIDSFEGGAIEIHFNHNRSRTGYELFTISIDHKL